MTFFPGEWTYTMSEDDDLKKHWDALTAGGWNLTPAMRNELLKVGGSGVWRASQACLHQGLHQPIHLQGVSATHQEQDHKQLDEACKIASV